MPTTHPPLSLPAVLFAHRGAGAHAPGNTLEAFALAVRLGATGLEGDIWASADGVAVLDDDGVVGARVRRRRIADLAQSDLPPEVPSVAQLYESCGTDRDLSVEVHDDRALTAVLAAAEAAGAGARLWLRHPDLEVLASWRTVVGPARLVHATTVSSMPRGSEAHAARLRELGVDAVSLHHSEWSAGSVALYHRFGRYCFGRDAQHPRIIRALLDMGIDGVSGDHVDRLVDSAAELA